MVTSFTTLGSHSQPSLLIWHFITSGTEKALWNKLRSRQNFSIGSNHFLLYSSQLVNCNCPTISHLTLHELGHWHKGRGKSYSCFMYMPWRQYGWSQDKDSYTHTFPLSGYKWSDYVPPVLPLGVPGTHWIKGGRSLKTVWTWWGSEKFLLISCPGLC